MLAPTHLIILMLIDTNYVTDLFELLTKLFLFVAFLCSSGSVCGPSFSSALSPCYWYGFTSGGRPTMTTVSLTGE